MADHRRALSRIKLLHTAVWFFFASCILAIPVLGVLGEFRAVAVLTGLVLLECVILALNGGRCPLTDAAGRFTEDRTANFDIYLPHWLAKYNKTIFGTLFAGGELLAIWLWLRA